MNGKTEEVKNKPMAKFESGLLDVAVWKNENEKGAFLSFSVQRSYKDQKGEWKNTDSLSLSRRDLLPLALLLQEAYAGTRKEKEE